jgi:lysozyme
MTPLEKLLVVHEGLELRPYFDTAEPPRLTIGVGRNLSDVGLRDEAEALYLLRRDIDAIERELDRLWPLWRHLDDVRRDVVFSMAFNLGVAGFMAFKKTRQYLVEGRYHSASLEMLRSKWADQVGHRAKELSTMMATGQRKK